MTLNGAMAVSLRYFSEFDSFRDALRKRSHSLSHLLMSSCLLLATASFLLLGLVTDHFVIWVELSFSSVCLSVRTITFEQNAGSSR